MALTQAGLVRVKDLKTEDFIFDEQAQKIGIKKGLKNAQLSGSTLLLTTSDNQSFTVPLAGLVPAAKADKFLKNVAYNSNTQKFIFTIGNDLNATTETIEVSASDLLPVTVGTGLTGNGTAATPLALDPNAIKPIATVELLGAFGEHIGWALTSSQRRSN